MSEDYFIYICLSKLLRLDLVFLTGAEQIVEERDIKLQDLYELDQAAVGDVQLAIEVEGARVAVGAVLGDLAIVDVAGQLGRVLVLFVLGLEGADADAVLLRQDQAVDLDVIEHLDPVPVGAGEALVVHLPAEGAESTTDSDVVVATAAGVQLLQNGRAQFERAEVQWFLLHRALLLRAFGH